MSAQDLLDKLSNVAKTKRGYSARCPAHDDANASLSISEGADGTVLIRCHAGCEAGDVVAAAGLSLADLFPKGHKAKKEANPAQQPVAKLPRDAAIPLTAAKRLAAAQLMSGQKLTLHTYTDANGTPLFWRIRCKNPKTGDKWMRPMHFNGTDYVLGEPAAPRAGKPLYLLPAVVASTGPVFVVEGESCADALAALDVPTTTSGGADSATVADVSPLAGREVVIWPDNDDAGAKYAAAMAERLRPIAASVEIIDVVALNLPDKGDAVDWLGANDAATAADVLALPRIAPPPNDADHLLRNLVPIADDVWSAAAVPHPHVFQDGHVGIFPRGEVTVIGSPGRTGKTTILVAAATRHLLAESLGGLQSTGTGPIVVLSAEDSPTQFARKLSAVAHFVKPKLWQKVKRGFIVPDFDDPLLAPLRQLVSLDRGQPAVAPEVATMVDALARLQAAQGIGAVFIETASTWNAANEDNPSFRALIAAAKQIARALNVAVVLTHHVNQSSGANLSKLDLSVADLRGGTTFVDNSRQVALLVNLGSDDNPFPDDDARTVLRRLVAPKVADKVSALVFLNSSQGDDVPPLYFQWVTTEHGPACIEVTPPSELQGRKWYAVREVVKAARPLRSEATKAAKLEDVLSIVEQMHKMRKAGGSPPTARAVSKHAGRHDTWATDALKEAVEQGLLSVSKQKVPRVKEKVEVYSPIAPNDPPNADPI